jgi:hypothetical protein
MPILILLITPFLSLLHSLGAIKFSKQKPNLAILIRHKDDLVLILGAESELSHTTLCQRMSLPSKLM